MMTFGVTDFATHIVVGFVLALVLAWLTGLRRVWWGLAGITAAVLAGGAGEAFQGLLSQRGMQGADWLAHAIGCAAAAPLYLLCMASRLCESPDARPSAPQADGVHTR
jgi:VanZ family protein